jgi:hypothetical protein
MFLVPLLLTSERLELSVLAADLAVNAIGFAPSGFSHYDEKSGVPICL